MAVLSPIVSKLKLDISEFTAGMARASSRMNTYTTNTTERLKETNAELTSHRLQLKDTARIVQGIMISQVFYGITRSINEATSALWNFNKELDYANISYSALFGDSKIATDFLDVLQEHAIDTIFTFQDLADSSKRLLAYGIDYKNLMFVMEGLTNLGAMSGDAEALDRIALALGQIYTKGKLSAEEMRQLSNAYIPITEIITEKFGLSGKDLERVGDLNLPAAEVINAIVDYANENFASVGDAAMLTITGLESRIKDTISVLGVEALKPLTKIYKSFLVFVSEGLENIRAAYASGGVGGIFEYLVPNENTQTIIRQTIANIKNFLMSLAPVGQLLGTVFSNAFNIFISAFNIVTPIISFVTTILAELLNALTSTTIGMTALRLAIIAAAAAFVILKVHALGAMVVTAVTKAVVGLTKALAILATIVSKHPILMLIAVLGMGLVGIAASSDKANSSLSKLFGNISKGIGGASVENTLQKVEGSLQNSSDAMGTFNHRLEEGAKAASDLQDSISGTGKAAKKTKDALGLLSFDEVFKLPEQADTSGGSGSGAGLGDGLLGDLGALTDAFNGIGDAIDLDIPDFSDIISSFETDLLQPLQDLLPDSFGNTILGGFLGALKGGLGKAFSSAFSGFFSKSLASGGIKGFIAGLSKGLSGITLKGVLKGGLIGAAIGLVTDGIASMLWSNLAEKFEGTSTETAAVGQTIGGAIGAVIGTIFGGPIGTAIGSVIGTFAGGFVGLFWDNIKKYFLNQWDELKTILSEWFPGIKERFLEHANNFLNGETLFDVGMALVQGIIDGIVFVVSTIGVTLWKLLVEPIIDGIRELFGINSPAETMKPIGRFLVLGIWEGIKSMLSTFLTNITTLASSVAEAFATWWKDITDGLNAWYEETKTNLTAWVTQRISDVTEWLNTLKTNIATWFTQRISDVTGWFNTLKTNISTWFTQRISNVAGWLNTLKTNISTWFTQRISDVTGWFNTLKTNISTWFTQRISDVTGWFNTLKTNISTWFTQRISDVTGWFNTLRANISTWFTQRISDVTGWFNTLRANISTWFTQRISDVKTWFGNLFNISTWRTGWSHVSAWFGTLRTSMSTWFTERVSNTKSWWEGLFDTSKWKSAWSLIKSWFDSLKTSISSWFTSLGTSVSTWWNNLWDGKSVNASASTGGSGGSFKLGGHATGGIFTKEHIARFAEGGKAEAVIPLENQSAMQPFVNAISDGLLQNILPSMSASGAGSTGLPPMYVGTLIADERGLQELFKKFEVYEAKELARKGAYA